jgi:multidrug resistance efflux pump
MLRVTVLAAALLMTAAAVSLGFYWPFGDNHGGRRYFGVVEIQEVRLGSKVGGRVAEVLVQEGQRVEAKQELIRFDVPELQAQRDQAAAKVEAAQAALDKAIAGPRKQELEAAAAAHAAAEARFERIQAGWRKEEKEQAQSDLEAATADLQLTRDVFNRIDRLFRTGPKGTVSQDEYDAALASRNRAQGRKDAAQARMNMLNTGSRKEDIAEAAAEMERADAQLRLLQAGTRPEEKAEAKAQLEESQARLRELDAQLREAVILAPEPAVIEVLAVRTGDVVPPNQPVLRVLRAQDLWVRIYVPETELARVTNGAEVKVKIDGVPNQLFTGKVIHIASISEFTPRNVQSADERRHQVFGVKVRVDDPNGVFKSGMAAEVFFEQ